MRLNDRHRVSRLVGAYFAFVALLASFLVVAAPPVSARAASQNPHVVPTRGVSSARYPGVGKPASKRPMVRASAATVTDPQGDSVSVSNLTVGSYSGGVVTCPKSGSVMAGDQIAFCAYVTVVDSMTGSQTTAVNSQSDSVYDACGNLVDYESSVGWHVSGSNPPYFVSSTVPSNPTTIPVSTSVCYGAWSVSFSFTQRFNDGVALTDTASVPFSVQISAAALAALYSQPQPTGGSIQAGETMGPNPSENQCQTCAGDPVNTATGGFYESYSDLAIPGRGPAPSLTRSYDSLRAGTDGPFGFGWTDSYAMSLTLSPSTIVVNQGTGAQVTFTLVNGVWSAPPRVLATLVQNGDGTWTFTSRATAIYRFDASGRLIAISDLNGYTTTVTYPSGSSMVVTDPSGRTLSFTLAGGHVTAVTDSSSPARSLTYSYDQAGNLTDVIDVGGGHWQFTYDGSHELLTVRTRACQMVCVREVPGSLK